MADRVAVPMRAPLRGVVAHRAPSGAGDASAAPRAVALLELGQAERRDAERHAERKACLQALRTSLNAVPEVLRENLQDVAAMAVEIGIAVAREVVGDALERGHVDPAPVVRRCLEEVTTGLPDDAVISVRAHPQDLPFLVEEVQGGAATVDPSRVDLVADPSLPRAAVRIDSAAGRLRYAHAEVLERIANQMREALAAGAAGEGSNEGGA